MSSGQLFSNNAIALLDVDLGPSDATILVQPGLGALFPSPGAGEWFLVTLENITSPLTREIVKVNGRVGDVLSVEARGQENTTAQSWVAGETLVDHRITAATLAAFTHAAAAPGELRVYDAGFALTNSVNTTVLTLNEQFVPGSTSLFVGGLRQKRTVDYTESAPQQITINYVVSPADVAAGQNIVVDYTPS